MESIFKGVAVALVTPFSKGKVDYISLGKLLEHCIKAEVDAIAINVTTSECVSLSNREREQIIKYSKRKLDGKAKLIVGTGHNNFGIAYEYTKKAKALGADAALVVTPYYNKTTQKGIIEYYKRLSEIGIPLIAYNVPSRTGLMIEIDTLKTLITNKYIVGLKESTEDISRIMKIMEISKNKIAVYSGEDKLNFIFYALGAEGCISVTANAYPSLVKKVYNLAKNKKINKSLALQNKLQKMNSLLFCETNPVSIKTLLESYNLCGSEVRLPLINMSSNNKTKLLKEAKVLDSKKLVK